NLNSRHKTFISVDEEGTEASASTSVVLAESGSLEVRFDRPFFFVIREVESDTILFMGTMNDPS
ncbi:MAG: serpin family protein, partial [Balneolaceae bacterium]